MRLLRHRQPIARQVLAISFALIAPSHVLGVVGPVCDFTLCSQPSGKGTCQTFTGGDSSNLCIALPVGGVGGGLAWQSGMARRDNAVIQPSHISLYTLEACAGGEADFMDIEGWRNFKDGEVVRMAYCGSIA